MPTEYEGEDHPPASHGVSWYVPRAQLRGWVEYLAALLAQAELAVLRGDPQACELVQRALVWFLDATPPGAAELDGYANVAILELDDPADGAARRLRQRREALAQAFLDR